MKPICFKKNKLDSNIRFVMKGYSFLRKMRRVGLIADLKHQLADIVFFNQKNLSSGSFYGCEVFDVNLVIQQYMMMNLGGLKFNKALLYCLGRKTKFVYPMPKEWQDVADSNGILVDRMRCSLLWNGYLFLCWGFGIFWIIKKIFESLFIIVLKRKQNLGRYVYFSGLTEQNLPSINSNQKNYDIISWYSLWNGRAQHIDSFVHNVSKAKLRYLQGKPVVSIQNSTLGFFRIKELVQFVIWSIKNILFSFIGFIYGRWWYPLFLKEAAQAACVRFQDCEDLARDYLFHNSGWIYRPLWTYEAEKKGSKILFFFYSTNCESFKTSLGYPLQENCWNLVNWSTYLVWDEYQANFIRRETKQKAAIQVVGPIWFSDKAVILPNISERAIAVFDVQPHRSSRYQILGAAQEYYIPDISKAFIEDIYSVLKEYDIKIIFKRKRNIGKNAHPYYRTFLDRIAKNPSFVLIDSDISAIRVIEKCSAVISMPFTSTAILAKEMGKPSIYYDSKGIIQKDDRASHGTTVFSGKEELKIWIDHLVQNERISKEND